MCLEVDGMFAMTDYTALLKRLEMEGRHVLNMHWGLNKMVAVLQTTFKTPFSCMKVFDFGI